MRDSVPDLGGSMHNQQEGGHPGRGEQMLCWHAATTASITLRTFMQVTPHTEATAVVVVGDTHGQYHDVCAM